MTKGNDKDNFGTVTLILGIVLYVFALCFVVIPLPEKFQPFLAVSWVFCPVIIGSIIYNNIEKKEGWRHSIRLK